MLLQNKNKNKKMVADAYQFRRETCLRNYQNVKTKRSACFFIAWSMPTVWLSYSCTGKGKYKKSLMEGIYCNFEIFQHETMIPQSERHLRLTAFHSILNPWKCRLPSTHLFQSLLKVFEICMINCLVFICTFIKLIYHEQEDHPWKPNECFLWSLKIFVLAAPKKMYKKY